MRPLYIFDLDGTLALIDHRRLILEDMSSPKDERWRRFFAACVDDTPNKPVIAVFKALLDEQRWNREGNDLWVWSGRSDEVVDETIVWINEHLWPWREADRNVRLKMRPAADKRSDVQLKREWLRAMSPEDRARLVAIFDDRQSVVDMYRAEGVCVFQVAPGDF